MIDKAQINGMGKAMGDALVQQRAQFDAHITVLEARIVKLEQLLGVGQQPDASAPADGAPASH